MIIQNIGRAVRKQDWATVLIEVLVVVIGILIGLQVDDWNEARKDKLKEQDYFERIYTELATDIEQIADSINLAEQRSAMGALLLASLDDPTLTSADPKAFFRAMQQAHYTYSPAINDFSFNELQFGGKLGIIRDVELRRDLTQYYAAIKSYDQWSYLREYLQVSYYEKMLGILTPEQQSKLVPYDPAAEFTAEEALKALQRMREKPGFSEQIQPSTNHGDVLNSYRNWLATALELRKRIEASIGQPD